MADLSDFVEIMDTLSTTLYETKQNVNIILEDQLSTHVTAEDLNNIKSAITQLAANINLINKYLINIANTSGNNSSSTNILDIYKENNNYIRQQQLVVDGNYVNDSVVYLDQYYVRVKNIFVDGFKMSYSSPYNLVSWSEFNNTIRNYLRNSNNYEGGRFITINSETNEDLIINKVNCTIQGEGVIAVTDNGFIKVRPGANGQVLKTVNGTPTWSIDNVNAYTGGAGIIINNNVISISAAPANVTKVLKSVEGVIRWLEDLQGSGADGNNWYKYTNANNDESLIFVDNGFNTESTIKVSTDWLNNHLDNYLSEYLDNYLDNYLTTNNYITSYIDHTYTNADTSLIFSDPDSTYKSTIKVSNSWLTGQVSSFLLGLEGNNVSTYDTLKRVKVNNVWKLKWMEDSNDGSGGSGGSGGSTGPTYHDGTYIHIDNEDNINCTLSGDGLTITINDTTNTLTLLAGAVGQVLMSIPDGGGNPPKVVWKNPRIYIGEDSIGSGIIKVIDETPFPDPNSPLNDYEGIQLSSKITLIPPTQTGFYALCCKRTAAADANEEDNIEYKWVEIKSCEELP